MKALVIALLGVLLVVTGCAHTVVGTPRAGAREVDLTAFFAGEVPTYGRSVTPDERATLAYLRALRRTDPCAFVNPAMLAKIGEIGSVGTTFAFNDCDVDVKVTGERDYRVFGVNLVMADVAPTSPVFTIGDLPVYPFDEYECGLQMPLPLSALPGAPPLNTPAKPYLQVAELLNTSGCEFTEELTKVIGAAMVSTPLPVRDALSAYPVAAAAHDPCEVIGSLRDVAGVDVTMWGVDVPSPYSCAFTVTRNGARTPVRVSAAPRTAWSPDSSFVPLDRDGAQVYFSAEYCSAVAFVGDELKRRTPSGLPVDIGPATTSPAVSVEVDAPHCDLAPELVAVAAKGFR